MISVAELVRSSHKNPGQRREIEDRLAKLLETGSPACKRFVCRQLWMGGSARCVPALARLLPDDEFSNDARYALERIADPSAAAALRNALGTCKGKTLIGVVNSLGQRRDSSAAVMLVPLLADLKGARSVADQASVHPGRDLALHRQPVQRHFPG